MWLTESVHVLLKVWWYRLFLLCIVIVGVTQKGRLECSSSHVLLLVEKILIIVIEGVVDPQKLSNTIHHFCRVGFHLFTGNKINL